MMYEMQEEMGLIDPKQPEKLTQDELRTILREEIDNARSAQEEMAGDQEEAEDYFYGRLPAVPEDDDELGYADVVSTDVADAVEAVLSEVLPAFADGPVEFEPLSVEDEQQAALESRAVHHVIVSRGGYMAINAACKDALLKRAGILKATWEERKVPTYQAQRGVPIQAILPALSQGAEITEGEMGMDGTASVTLRTYRNESRPRIDVVPRDEFLLSRGASILNIDDSRLVAQQRTVTRSELVEWGFDAEMVADLKDYPGYYRTSARQAEAGWDESTHKSTEPVMAIDAYLRVDADGDGIAELRRIVSAGGDDGTDVILFDETVAEQPFCVGVPYLGLNTWEGVSLFDKLKSIQDVKTGILRDLLDASHRNARQRLGAVERDANMDDLLTSVRGGVVRCKTPSGVFALPDVPFPQALFGMLEYSDKLRRDKGGGAIDTAAQAQAMTGDTAHGIERMMSAVEAVNAMLARNLAETLIKPLYRKMHDLLRSHQQQPLMVPGAGGYQAMQPGQWPQRTDMVMSMGMSTGERGRRTSALMAIGQAQQQAMQQGLTGQLVGLPQIYQTAVDIGRMAGLPSPEQYWIDPESQQSQQAQQAAAQQAQQAQQMAQAQQQQAVQLAQMQATSLQQVEQIRSQNDLQLQAMKNQMDRMKTMLSHQEAMFAQRVKLLGIEVQTDAADAQRGIDEMQEDRVRVVESQQRG